MGNRPGMGEVVFVLLPEPEGDALKDENGSFLMFDTFKDAEDSAHEYGLTAGNVREFRLYYLPPQDCKDG